MIDVSAAAASADATSGAASPTAAWRGEIEIYDAQGKPILNPPQ